ncbi:MAG: plasminogen-binding N-terminal domain-containing protein [Campylobacterota bacterium]|nr:plasminogen-binding N-terminal domain-containing protein [Campylobacterota bacterium]
MKKIFIFLILTIQLMAGVIKAPIITLDNNSLTAKIEISKADIGMSGFIVQKISDNHTTILNTITVSSFDKENKIASLKMGEYRKLQNSALPSGKWSAKVGDIAVLGFSYDRALLIAPSENIYYRISKSVKVQWLHPDIFTAMLSLNGHPTPLKEDFDFMVKSTSIGLIFIYLEQKLYTLDAQSFTILNISETPLIQEKVIHPFYSRVKEIEADWWGEGSDKMKDYELYYYQLLTEYNSYNKKLYENIKESDKEVGFLLEKFEIKE